MINSHSSRAEAQRQLLQLGQQMLTHANAGDWEAVQATDSRLSQLLQTFKQDQALWHALQEPRRIARQWHVEVCKMCRIELDSRKKEWQGMSENQEGLRAYSEAELWS